MVYLFLFRATDHQRLTNAISIKRLRNMQNVVQHYCRQLQKKYVLNGKLRCHRCSLDLKIGRCNGTSNVIDHVRAIHLKKILYTCRLCPMGFGAYRSITMHIRKKHQVSGIGQYKDDSMKYETEIKNLLRQCFDNNDQDQEPMIQSIVSKGEQENDTILKTSSVTKKSIKSIEITNIEINRSERKKSKIETERIIDEGTKMENRFSCNICEFSTNFSVLIKRHCAVFHS